MYIHEMNTHSHILIIGGGLAGLTSAIHLAKEGMSVSLIEKDNYPKHKVCGEYISNEIVPYFDFLEINLDHIQPTRITEFAISTQKGDVIRSKLPLGGFGVSRYTLDHYLWNKASESGVQLIQDQVVDIRYKKDMFVIKTSTNQTFTGDYVIGAHGKRSLLDRTLQRNFNDKKSPWLAVKAHYKADFDSNIVALHNFKGGYCGLSMVENNIVNACYLVHYKSFKKYKDLALFEKEVLSQNPHLRSFFNAAILLFEKPITISQINFEKKKPVENHVFMVGDAAGLIHPLCGNGMAMAIQGAQMICELLVKNKESVNIVSRNELERKYTKNWNAVFAKRIYTGRMLQKILLNGNLQKFSYTLANALPAIVPKIIKQTHGNPLVC